MKILSIFALFIITLQVLADGPPIKNGNLSVPYVSLRLSGEQVMQAGVYRVIQLSSEQKNILKAVAGTKVPDLLPIITDPYNDCSCGMFFYGLWANEYEVQVAKAGLGYLKDEDFSEYLDTTKNISGFQKKMDRNELNIDKNGNVYQNGSIVNNLGIALTGIESYAKVNADKEGKYVFVNTPPLNNKSALDNSVRTYLNIKHFFEGKGYSVYAYFENEYINNIDKGYEKLPAYNAQNFSASLPNLIRDYPVCFNGKCNFKTSSTARWKDIEYSAGNLSDTSLATAWVEGMPGHGINETVSFHLADKSSKTITGIVIANGFQKSKDLFLKNSRVRTIVVSLNNKPVYLLHISDITGLQKVEFPGITITSSDQLVFKIVDIYGGVKYQDTAISMLIVL